METLKQMQLAFLEETIAHYNSTNRAMLNGSTNRCVYRPLNNSEGCAIGRHITNKKLCDKLDCMGGVHNEDVFNLLPKKLKKLGKAFLHEMQCLHDVKSYWDKNGLTEAGREKVKSIKYLVDTN